MIAFVTLLLGLISGIYPIQVNVGGAVAAVEFTLDGAPAGRIEGPPWIAKVDLGTDLRPRVLTAHALDAEGREISQVTQWLNIPRPPAEVDIVLENGPDGRPAAAHLTWQNVSGVRPASISLTLDGEPLSAEVKDGTGRAPLTVRDLKALHILTAELWFPPGLVARQDVAFGGEYGSEVSTELTAVPVRVRKGESLPGLDGLQGWFAAEDQTLAAAAIEDGPGKVVFVQVPARSAVLRELLPGQRRRSVDLLENEMRLGKDDRVRFLSLAPSSYRESRIPSQLFDMSTELTPKDGGVFWYLTKRQTFKQPEIERLRIADAVAVAGLQAAADNHRRAVVLVVGKETPDASRYDPVTVRRYLESIRVPLFVWSLYGPDAPVARAWGEAEDVSTLEKLGQAVNRLRTEMASQKVVWVEGRHLPQAISLTPAAKGVELVVKRVPQP
ncbi:MAG TPA: hypothetical protein VIW92_03305 [Thermoanaerobaculia bacterium]